ncbi:unnamed protein product [Pleuronectes platessa]|uniref:Uncharacterized protein n=1 Tax=Pleuronectes platessa TaxID=8262 RepID=A0A9N7VDY2_PLEPL|nr:unnamed protein product [Pleuronectes platessa]
MQDARRQSSRFWTAGLLAIPLHQPDGYRVVGLCPISVHKDFQPLLPSSPDLSIQGRLPISVETLKAMKWSFARSPFKTIFNHKGCGYNDTQKRKGEAAFGVDATNGKI